MNWYDGEINNRIKTGRLPTERLVVVPVEKKEIFNDKGNAKVKLSKLEGDSFLKTYKEEIDNLLDKHIVNAFINTESDVDNAIYNTELLEKAIEPKPFITELDEFLWYIIVVYYNLYTQCGGEKTKEKKKNLNSLIRLLIDVESKEIKNKCTINLSELNDSEILFDIIYGEWNANQKYFCNLKKEDEEELVILKGKRKVLINELRSDNDEAFQVALETQKEWEVFIKDANDLSRREKNAVSAIVNYDSKYEKIGAIKKYTSTICDVQDKKYTLKNKKVNLSDFLTKVLKRFLLAPQYCIVKTDNSEPFVIHPIIAGLVVFPYTFNNYLIMFHQLRLDPSKEVAEAFSRLSYDLICNNLEAEHKKLTSIDEIISNYHQVVKEYIETNEQIISETKFDNIQKDAASIPGISQFFYANESYNIKTRDLINRKIKKASHTSTSESVEEITMNFKKIDDISEEESFVKQLAVSINMIYLFAHSIDIMLGNKHLLLINNVEQVKREKNDLLKIESQLVNTVYDENSNKMYHHRDEEGIAIERMTQEEQAQDRRDSELFVSILRGGIEEIINTNQEDSIDDILKTKKKIIKKISEFPGCYAKELYAGFIDQIVNDLCNRLIELCKNLGDNFEGYKTELIKELGTNYSVLPSKTIDSLTTAEMLFDKYANIEFAEKGFDYSCVSVLYYQALEMAYNNLIWKKYSEKLNSAVVNNRMLIDYFSKRDYQENEEVYKYLGNNHRQLRYYFDPQSGEFRKECMYKTFKILLDTAFNENKAEYFLDYFADITKFESTNSMKNNEHFITICRAFISDFDDSVDKRNNASHGGSEVSLDNCKEDKNKVLNNIGTIRSEEKGLIKQFIKILTYNY